MESPKTAASSGNPASRSRSTTNASDASRGRSLAQPTMNSSAFGSRSRSRNGEGSMASNNCLNSPTCTSMTAHLAGIGAPADAFSFERLVTALVRFCQDPKREAVPRLVNSLDDLSDHHRHTNTYQVSKIRTQHHALDSRRSGSATSPRLLESTLQVPQLRSCPSAFKLTAWLIAMRNLRLLLDVSRRRWD